MKKSTKTSITEVSIVFEVDKKGELVENIITKNRRKKITTEITKNPLDQKTIDYIAEANFEGGNGGWKMPTEKEKAEILRMYLSGLYPTEIAFLTQRSQRIVDYIISYYKRHQRKIYDSERAFRLEQVKDMEHNLFEKIKLRQDLIKKSEEDIMSGRKYGGKSITPIADTQTLELLDNEISALTIAYSQFCV